MWMRPFINSTRRITLNNVHAFNYHARAFERRFRAFGLCLDDVPRIRRPGMARRFGIFGMSISSLFFGCLPLLLGQPWSFWVPERSHITWYFVLLCRRGGGWEYQGSVASVPNSFLYIACRPKGWCRDRADLGELGPRRTGQHYVPYLWSPEMGSG